MTETPNHGYNRPDKGAIDWHLDLNENFENIDDDVEIRDTEANKGDYEPKKGAKYFATDTGGVYLGNGSSWVLNDRKSSTVQLDNLQSKPIWVGDASSDGHEYVGYDDLTTAFDNLPWQAEVFIHGNVTVGETLAPENSYLYLHGHGGYNRPDQDGMPSITAESNFTGSHLIDLGGIGSKWGSIQNINLFCNGNVPNGISTGRSDNGLIRDIAIYRASGDHLIEIRNGAFDNIIDRCEINAKDETDYGVRIWEPNEGRNGGNEPKIYSSLIRAYNEAGVYVNNVGSVGLRMEDCSMRGGGPDSTPGKYGLLIDNGGNTRHSVIERCQFETHSEAGIFYDGIKDPKGGAVANFVVSRCTFNQQAQLSLKVRGKTGNILFGPFNLTDAPMDIDALSGSQGRYVSMFNIVPGGNDPYEGWAEGNFRAVGPDPAFIEPFLDNPRFEFPGNTIKWGDTHDSGNYRTSELVENRLPVDNGEQTNLFDSGMKLGSFTLCKISNTDDHVAQFINAGNTASSGNGMHIIGQDGSYFSTTESNSGTVNVFNGSGGVKIENLSGSGGEFQVIGTSTWDG